MVGVWSAVSTCGQTVSDGEGRLRTTDQCMVLGLFLMQLSWEGSSLVVTLTPERLGLLVWNRISGISGRPYICKAALHFLASCLYLRNAEIQACDITLDVCGSGDQAQDFVHAE